MGEHTSWDLGLVWIGRRTRRKGGRERAKAIEIWESVEVEGLAYIDRRGGGAVFIRSRVIWLVSLREQVTSFEFYYASSSLLSLSLSTWILTRTILESQDTVLL